MDESIVQVPLYASAAAWRSDAQLCGLLRNHPSVLTRSGPLAAPGTLFTAARLALHSTESAVAVGLSPIGCGGSVGLAAVDGPFPTLDGAAHTRWLDLPPDAPLASLDWCNSLLLAGSTRGRVLVATLDPRNVADAGGPLSLTGCLVASEAMTAVGEVAVAPSGYATSTMVRSVRCNAAVDPARVVAAVGGRAAVWDMSRSEQPMGQWCIKTDEPPPMLFAHWAPSTSSVILAGDVEGHLSLLDMRTLPSVTAGDGSNTVLQLPMPTGAAVRAADFNTLLPAVLAASSADGTIAVFDCRFASAPVRIMPSLQGDVSAVRFLRLHSDLLATAGTDGTVALWSLRLPPTYCVGRAQYSGPVSDLVATQTFVEERVFGLTCGAELTLTGFSREALLTLAPPIAAPSQSQSQASIPKQKTSSHQQQHQHNHHGNHFMVEDPPHLVERERLGCGLLYARELREAFEVIADCAMERFERKDTAVATALVSLVDVVAVPRMDYAELLRSGPQSAIAVQNFDDLLNRTSARLCMTLPLDRIRALPRPNPEDLRKLEALRLNTLLQQVLQSGDTGMVVSGLHLFAANAGSLELVDSETACGIASMLLRDRYAEGERFVRTLLGLLIRQDGTAIAPTLTRRLLIVVQEPLVTAGLPAREERRREERFLRRLSDARAAVEVQLSILGMGIEHHRQVVAAVNAYQRRCLESGQTGIFGWLALKPLLLFLHCLTADSNYATFFWACVQLMEALGRCPSARQVETILFGTVNRISSASGRIRVEVQQTARTRRFAPPLLRAAAKTLVTVHEFLVVLLRVQLECENVAIESNMAEVPPVMTRIFEVLSNASSDLLEAWAALLGSLAECQLKDFVRKTCAAPVRNFARRVEGLMDISSKKDEDETLNEVLDTCDDFLDKVLDDESNDDDEGDEDDGE